MFLNKLGVDSVPSQYLHRKIGELVCGKYFKSLDMLIDSKPRIKREGIASGEDRALRYARGIAFGGSANVEILCEAHDSSRVNCKEFVEQIKNVYNAYGYEGVCYYILHHYLDKVMSILRGMDSKLQRVIIHGEADIGKIRDLFRVLLNMEASVLFIFRHWNRIRENLENASILIDNILKSYSLKAPYGKLTRNTLRRKRNLIIAILESCRDVWDELDEVARIVNRVQHHVMEWICMNFDIVVCEILRDRFRRKNVPLSSERPLIKFLWNALECEEAKEEVEGLR